MKKSVLLFPIIIGIFIVFSVCTTLIVNAQGVGVNTSNNPPDNSAMLDVSSTTKGMLIPRMTTAERDAIVSPADGLQIFNLTSGCLNYRFNNQWLELCGTCSPFPTTAAAGSDQLNLSGTNATLAANTPVNGTGVWSIISGTGGNFSGSPTSTNPSAVFTGVGGNSYVLRWTITTVCASSTDDVSISFNQPFTCGVTTITYSGQTYNTVQIGTQCWLKENLNVGTMVDGSTNQTNNATIEKYCQQNNASNCNTYGGLYQWNEAMQYSSTPGTQGICPTGWHFPTDAEWQTLEVYAGMSPGDAASTGYRGTIAGQLRIGGSTGLDILMSGIRQPPNLFYDMGAQAQQWTSTPGSGNSGYWRHIYSSGGTIGRFNNADAYGHAVRCIKN